MALLRIFRSIPHKANQGDNPEVKRLLTRNRGPLDRPAGLREPHCYMRGLDGRW